MKTIIGIGPRVDKTSGGVTGLSMMFELTMTVFKEDGYSLTYVNLNNRFCKSNSNIAKPSITNFINYSIIYMELILKLIIFPYAIVYINPAPTKFGLKRDSLVVMLAKIFGHKVIFHQFGALFENFYKELSVREEKTVNHIYNKVDVLIVEGSYAKEQYSFINNQDKIHVVNNGLPEKDCVKVVKPKSFNQLESFNMFFMNNMIESKGYIDVLKAVDILVNQMGLNVTCTFAGRFLSVPDDKHFKSTLDARQWLDSFIKEHSLSERVIYRNSVFGADKSELFLKSHVFLLPSYYVFEGQPTAILEALAYGCVPIVTNYRLIPEMVNENNGLFVSSESPTEIAEAIKKLYTNSDYYTMLSQGAIERFNKDFTREQYANRIKNITNKIT